MISFFEVAITTIVNTKVSFARIKVHIIYIFIQFYEPLHLSVNVTLFKFSNYKIRLPFFFFVEVPAVMQVSTTKASYSTHMQKVMSK